MELEKSKTYENLQQALQGEMMASTKYRLFSEKAKEDGYMQIANIFQETAGNEQEHAEIWWKVLNGGKKPDTEENLMQASKAERQEWQYMYQDFANTAEQEGFMEIAALFRGVADIEQHHDFRFDELSKNIQNEEVFCKGEAVLWFCLNCGNISYGECAPHQCPVCGYSQGYYEMLCENY